MPVKHWLFKSEPECYSMDDLKKKRNQTDHWDGVRNYQARNLLRDEVKKGDYVLFYYSSTEPIGIAGTAVVISDGYPDHTARDPNNQHFDPQATEDNPRWYMVDIKYVREFKSVIPLRLLKQTPGLEKMMVTQRGNRLSIQPVTKTEFEIVTALADRL